MKIANLLALSRLGIVPIIIYLLVQETALASLLALLLFILALISDFLDGYLARLRKETSKVGSFLDLFADKTLVFGSLLYFTWRDDFSGWIFYRGNDQRCLRPRRGHGYRAQQYSQPWRQRGDRFATGARNLFHRAPAADAGDPGRTERAGRHPYLHTSAREHCRIGAYPSGTGQPPRGWRRTVRAAQGISAAASSLRVVPH